MPPRLYQVAVRHPGLNAYRVISGTDWFAVNMKARVQYDAWEQEWRRRQAQDMAGAAREAAKRREAAARHEQALRRSAKWAAEQTTEAQRAIAAVDATLANAVGVDSAIDWDALVDRSEYPKPPPEPPRVQPPADVPSPGEPPDEGNTRYQPHLGLLGRLSSSTRDARVAAARERLETDRRRWAEGVTAARAARAVNEDRYADTVRRAQDDFAARRAAWEQEQSAFLAERSARNAELADRRRRYEERQPDAVVAFCHMVLARSDYPDEWPRDVAVEYDGETLGAVVDLALPPVDVLPDVKEVVYDSANGRFAVVRLSGAERAALHERLIYAIPIRTVHELFEADRAGALANVAVNGWVRARDAGDVHDRCVVSLAVDRTAFAQIDLATADPKAVFRALGGIGWSEHYNLDAISPVVESEQARAGESPAPLATAAMYGRLGLDEMSAEDFEHLTRDLVEREIARDDEQVSMARVVGGADALVLAAKTRRVRVLVHARRLAGACSLDAVRSLRASADYERAHEAVFISTEEAEANERALASELGVALVDGPRLLNLLARHAGRLDPRATGPVGGETGDLDDGPSRE